MIVSSQGKRFANLDGLRFFAALLVLLTHVEVFKHIFGYPNFSLRLFRVSSHIAVTFFFVLSGFLITYYLLAEKKAAGKISLISFYKRRIARIWPLYYLLLILNFFILSNVEIFHYGNIPFGNDDAHFFQKLISCFFLLPNFAELKFGSLMYMKISWTIAVEEFFYLFLPLIIYYANIKRLPQIFLAIFIFFVILSLTLPFLIRVYNFQNSFPGMVEFYLDRYRLYAFASGALAACCYVFPAVKMPFLYLLKNRTISWILLVVFFIFTLFGVTFSFLNHQLYSIFFAALILSLCYTNISPCLLNNSIVKYLGKISYGIYMLHPIVIVFVMTMGATTFLKQSTITAFLSLYGIILILTILVCSISYELFEKRFLVFRKIKKESDMK